VGLVNIYLLVHEKLCTKESGQTQANQHAQTSSQYMGHNKETQMNIH